MEGLTLEALLKVVSTVGFPIAVCWFVLTRLEKALKELTDKLNTLITTIGGGK